jgi:hypothetical protein
MADDSQQAQALPALSRRHRGKGILRTRESRRFQLRSESEGESSASSNKRTAACCNRKNSKDGPRSWQCQSRKSMLWPSRQGWCHVACTVSSLKNAVRIFALCVSVRMWSERAKRQFPCKPGLKPATAQIKQPQIAILGSTISGSD